MRLRRPMPTAAPVYFVRDNVGKHRFEVDLGDGSVAIAQYTLPKGKIVFIHTEVPPAHRGKGVGTALIRFALASARERGLEVIPICPFFAAYIAEHPEEQDLLDPAYRKILKSN
jgi:predicted GNAT family acetyltransferase